MVILFIITYLVTTKSQFSKGICFVDCINAYFNRNLGIIKSVTIIPAAIKPVNDDHTRIVWMCISAYVDDLLHGCHCSKPADRPIADHIVPATETAMVTFA